MKDYEIIINYLLLKYFSINLKTNQITNQLIKKTMPYIEKDLVRKIREEIKKEFPTFKFSVTRHNYSSVTVSLLSCGDPNFAGFNGKYIQVNHYYINEHYKDNPVVAGVLSKINNIINQKNGVLCIDADYGTVPNYYVNINIGQWGRPFILTN